MKKKPYKTVASNVGWTVGKLLRYSPVSFILQLAGVPVNVGLAFAAVYLPSLAVAVVTENRPAEYAAAAVGGLMLAILLGELLKEFFGYLIDGNLGIYRYHITNELNMKSLGCFYQTFESKPMRDLLNRAEKATQMWDGVQPVSDMPRQAWSILENVLCYFLFGAVITFVSPWLLPILTLAPAVNWFAVRAYDNWCYKKREKWSDIDTRLGYISQKPTDFRLAKDIRIYGLAGWLTEIYRNISRERDSADREQRRKYFLSRLADLAVILLRDGAAYALLIAMTLRGEITVDKFVLYFAAISSFADFIGKILSGWNSLRKTSLELCDLREYLDIPENDGTGEAKLADFLGSAPEIEFDNVTFRYDGAERDTLCGVSFTIHPGEKLALVGLNGAGKTTLVKLLCGLYLPTSGEIRINGVSVKKFRRNDYYKLFSPVFQDIKTAFFSLAETVSCRLPDETDFARAERCMREAGLAEKLAALPDGIRTKLDKQVNKDGTELSGGEAQKLMLARALYKDAPVLVLDEPTAALDPIAENEIYVRYNELSRGKSSLFISHRLASTRFCDRVIYLKDGEITESGTHAELVASGGEYSRLYEMQSCWYREGAEHEAT